MDENLKLSNLQINFQKICRTCLIGKNNLQSIFRIIDLLRECTSIHIDLEDDLPKLICFECIDKLNNAFEFRKQCKLSEKTLFKLREIKVMPVKFESYESNPQSHKIENLKTNEIDIKSENSYNTSEDILDTEETIKFKIKNVYSIVEIKSLNNVAFDNQPLSDLKIENSDSIHENNDFAKQRNDKFIVLKKTQCSKKYSRQKTKLKVKRNDNTIKTSLPCPQCKKCFELEVDLEVHMFKHQKFDDLICPKCSKSFENEHSLKQHFNTHMINKPYKCNVCDKSFAGAGDRNRHLRIHTGEKPFICSSCGKRYPDSSKLAAHMKYHIGVKNCVCTICSKSFMLQSELRRHMRVHTGEKPYLCTECGERFSQSYHLTKHKRKHTGERPYSCTECDKNFRLKEQLKFHLRTHTGYKPHICNVCHMGFARPDSLVIHNRSHTGERPYCCDICEKKFMSSKHLSQHKRTHNKGR